MSARTEMFERMHARLFARFGYGEENDPGVAPSKAERNVERTIHELAHAAVFGMEPDAHGHRLSDEIARWFHRFRNDDGFFGPDERAASDRSELDAMAVELLAAADIGLRLRAKVLVYTAAFQHYVEDEAWREVNARLSLPITRKRADRVVRWVHA